MLRLNQGINNLVQAAALMRESHTVQRPVYDLGYDRSGSEEEHESVFSRLEGMERIWPTVDEHRRPRTVNGSPEKICPTS